MASDEGQAAPDTSSPIMELFAVWAKKREEEAATMCATRRLTEAEIDRALVIAKWFLGWTPETGECPIRGTNEHWNHKLFALFEWISFLESENKKGRRCKRQKKGKP